MLEVERGEGGERGKRGRERTGDSAGDEVDGGDATGGAGYAIPGARVGSGLPAGGEAGEGAGKVEHGVYVVGGSGGAALDRAEAEEEEEEKDEQAAVLLPPHHFCSRRLTPHTIGDENGGCNGGRRKCGAF